MSDDLSDVKKMYMPVQLSKDFRAERVKYLERKCVIV